MGYTTVGGGGGGSGDLLAANNLSDVGNAATALSNLGGLSVKTVTATTGSIAGGGAGSQNKSVSVAGSNICIIGCQLTRTAGASTSASVEAHSTDAFGDVNPAYLYGSSFSGVTIATNPVFGPLTAVGGSNLKVAVPYQDADATSEIHLTIKNQDASATNVGTFSLALRYLTFSF